MLPFVQVVLQITNEFSQKDLESFLKFGKADKKVNDILSESLKLFNMGAIGKLTRLLQNRLFPREAAFYIKKGILDSHHIGEMTKEVMAQEIKALLQTNDAFRDSDWKVRITSLFKRADKENKTQIKNTFPEENF